MGYAQYLPKDEYLHSTEQIRDKMCMALGGRASEQVFFGKITTGAHDDLKKVTRMAQAQVVDYGMNPRIGQVSYSGNSDSQIHKPYSEETGRMIDEEIRNMVTELYEKTLNLIRERKKEVELVAETLLKKEVLSREDMIELLGPRPFDEKHPFDLLLEKKTEESPIEKKIEDKPSPSLSP